MIVPMKKLCLAVQNKNTKEAMTKLREVGAVHIVKSGAASEGLEKTFQDKARLEGAIGLIQPYTASKKKTSAPRERGNGTWEGNRERRATPTGRRGRRATDHYNEELEPYSLDAVKAPVRPDLVELMLGIGEEQKMLEDKITLLARECDRLAPWGEFDPQIFEELAALGHPAYLYEIPLNALGNIQEDIDYIKVSADKDFARIIVLEKQIPEVTPFLLPQKPLSALEAELSKLRERYAELEEKIKGFADRRSVLENRMIDIENDINFEEVMAELDEIEGVPPEFGVSYLKGYAPAEKVEDIKAVAKENGWAIACAEPALEDNPPTLTKNKPAMRIIQPLLSFLGTVPGYREFDISPSYLIFFSIFFAMIFGDAAYGLLIFGIAGALAINFKKKKGAVPDILKLVMVLGSSTVIWGALNGAWFAIPSENLPRFLQVFIFPPFNRVNPHLEFPLFLQNIFRLPAEIQDVSRWSIQFLCFTIAVIQLTWARAKRIKRALPSLTAVAQIGWYLTVIGLYFVVLFMLLGVELPFFAPVLIGAGVFLILVFSEQNGGNFFINIGKSFGNLFQLFLKVVSCFGDVISFIRLFAVGLAGSIIAEIVNEMAIGDGLGAFGAAFIFRLLGTVLILVFGHGLNLALNTLSVVVHGVRLNLLEYAGNHLEMEWSGYEYKPFALKQKNKQQ